VIVGPGASASLLHAPGDSRSRKRVGVACEFNLLAFGEQNCTRS